MASFAQLIFRLDFYVRLNEKNWLNPPNLGIVEIKKILLVDSSTTTTNRQVGGTYSIMAAATAATNNPTFDRNWVLKLCATNIGGLEIVGLPDAVAAVITWRQSSQQLSTGRIFLIPTISQLNFRLSFKSKQDIQLRNLLFAVSICRMERCALEANCTLLNCFVIKINAMEFNVVAHSSSLIVSCQIFKKDKSPKFYGCKFPIWHKSKDCYWVSMSYCMLVLVIKRISHVFDVRLINLSSVVRCVRWLCLRYTTVCVKYDCMRGPIAVCRTFHWIRVPWTIWLQRQFIWIFQIQENGDLFRQTFFFGEFSLPSVIVYSFGICRTYSRESHSG